MGVPDLYIMVALHPEGVDRNAEKMPVIQEQIVALHPEGVDRNLMPLRLQMSATRVALHPEGVDRNHSAPSSLNRYHVALHPEGVDRNHNVVSWDITTIGSPSTRRAWIETSHLKT